MTQGRSSDSGAPEKRHASDADFPVENLKQENAQLKACIIALRAELENAVRDRNDILHDARADARDETAQLQNTIQAQREAMETERDRHVREIRELRLGCESEIQQLRETIQALREKLEQSAA